MDDNKRLARELMGWTVGHGGCNSDVYEDRSKTYRYVMPCSEWHPNSGGALGDAQADMVVREVAKLGFNWVITSYCNLSGGKVRESFVVSLYPPSKPVVHPDDYREPEPIYHSDGTNRNLHIIAAAIAALDAEKPQPHKCEKMPKGSYWLEKDHGWDLHSERQSPSTHRNSTHCSFCGADLNE